MSSRCFTNWAKNVCPNLKDCLLYTSDANAEAANPMGTFTQNDLHFLRSLRISVEGEKDEAGTDIK